METNNMKTRSLSCRLFRAALLLLVFMLGLAGVPSPAYAFSGSGSGTPDDPYIITTPAELDEVRNDTRACYKLGNDIDMSGWGNWTPIGWSGGDSYPFVGMFDGDYHTISGLTINHPDRNYVGLFCGLGSSNSPYNTVLNLRLTNVNVLGQQYVGGLVGQARYGARIERVYVDGVVSSSGSEGYCAGGVVGNMGWYGTATMSQCVSKATVTTTWTIAGGLTGTVSLDPYGGKPPYVVSDSYATGSVTASADNGTAGGLAGWVEGTVLRCYSVGSVTGGRVGRLAGYADSTAVCESSYWDNSTGTSAMGTGKTTAQLKQQATYEGWDFSKVWGINPGVSFPYLRWETRPVMRGSVSITGTAKVGQMLTVDTSGLTYTAAAPGNVLTYQWKRDGAVVSEGTGNTTYLLGADDIGKRMTVVVTADDDHAQGRVVSPATAVVAKMDGAAAPSAPELAQKTHRVVTLTPIEGYEYRVNGGSWQDSSTFSGLMPETTYTFICRVKETATHYASAESAGISVTTDAPPVMQGTVTISGDLKYEATLTAVVSDITYTPDTSSGNVFKYQWARGGADIDGATGSTYKLVQADIGQTISVTVSADGVNAQGSIRSAESDVVTKAESAAPTTLAMTRKTHNSITLAANPAWEYRLTATGEWQSSNVFEGLSPTTQYSFWARVRETETHFASPASAELVVTTNAPPVMGGTVAILGVRQYGCTLTADMTGITYTPDESSGNVFTYQWMRDGEVIDRANGQTYLLVQEDIGAIISVTVTADGVNAQGSVTGTAASAIEKADTPAPGAPVLDSKEHRTVWLVDTDDTLEYSCGDGVWQDSGTFTLLQPSTAYTFTARVKETSTHKASPASLGLVVTTDAPPIMGGLVTISGDLKYGEVLTAVTTGVTYTPDTSVGNLFSYQWKRGGAAIAGATGSTYELVEADVGQTISVTVTADGVNAQGSLTATASAVVDKADAPPAPAAPSAALTVVTFKSVTLPANSAYEFSRGDVDGDGEDDWQGGANGHVFLGLEPETEYSFRARVAETQTHKVSPASDPLTVITPAKPVMGGSASIRGILQWGETLSADLSDITYTPHTSLDNPTFQWMRGDEDILGATADRYQLTVDDIGRVIQVRVIADGIEADGSVLSPATAAVEKADRDAPSTAPALSGKTVTTVTLMSDPLLQFSRGDVDGDGSADWQDEPGFSGLRPNTEYFFVSRFKETETHKASPAGPELRVITDPDVSAPVWPVDSVLRSKLSGAYWIMLEWSPATDNVGVTSYRVYEGERLVATSAALSCYVRDLTPLTSYQFRVEAGDESGNWSEFGPTLTVSTIQAPQTDPFWLGIDLPVGLEHWTGAYDLQVECPPGAKSYSIDLLGNALSRSGTDGMLVVDTGICTVSIPSNMLAGQTVPGTAPVKLIIESGDKDALPEDVKEAVGDRPLIRLSLHIQGEAAAWSNPDAPVTISIPYEPSDEELQNPEAITVWYIDGDGNPVAVPSGRYDASTGTVTFTTTHFSDYAVVFVEKSFEDLQGVSWAKKQIEALASKGIIKGTSETTFSPSANVTRADFLVLLVRTLGLSAREAGTFVDVLPSDYYHDAVGIAKSLGITDGVDAVRFAPGASITRQDMMVLAARALKLVGKLPAMSTPASVSSALDKYSDASDIDSYAVDCIASLVNAELIGGDNGRINPKGNATRAEAAVFLYRVYRR